MNSCCLVFAPFLYFIANAASAEALNEPAVQVGKHVTESMDAVSMILSLLMVLALIIISAMVLKRFQGEQQSVSGLKIVSSLHLGPKEKIVVVQAGEQQLLLGVTAHNVNLLKTLDEPLTSDKVKTPDVVQSFSQLLKKKAIKNDE